MGKKELGNNNLLMRLNKRIGSRNVITAIAATVFIIIFLIGNYICNVISATLSSNYNNLFGAAQLVRLRAFRHPFTTFLFFLFLVADVAYVLILTYRIYTSYTDMNIGQKVQRDLQQLMKLKSNILLLMIKMRNLKVMVEYQLPGLIISSI